MKDEDIDFTDIPELTPEWFAKAKMLNVPGQPPAFVGRAPGQASTPAQAKSEANLRTIELAPDVAAAFKTADEVNDALRTILRAAERLKEHKTPAEPVAKAG